MREERQLQRGGGGPRVQGEAPAVQRGKGQVRPHRPARLHEELGKVRRGSLINDNRKCPALPSHYNYSDQPCANFFWSPLSSFEHDFQTGLLNQMRAKFVQNFQTGPLFGLLLFSAILSAVGSCGLFFHYLCNEQSWAFGFCSALWLKL